jgi:hypothetical protein
MPDDFPDYVRRRSKIEKQRRASMAKIMKAHCAESGIVANRCPAPTQVIGLHRRAPPGRADQTVILPIWPGVGSLCELPLPVFLRASTQGEGSGTVRAESSVLGGTRRLRFAAPRARSALRSGLRPHARGRASSMLGPVDEGGSSPLPDYPALPGTRRERFASLRDGLRPLPTEPGRESPVMAAIGGGAGCD